MLLYQKSRSKKSAQTLWHKKQQPSEGYFVIRYFLIVNNETGELIVDWFHMYRLFQLCFSYNRFEAVYLVLILWMLAAGIFGRLFTIQTTYMSRTYTKISLRLLSTGVSLTNVIKTRVCTKSRKRLFLAALFYFYDVRVSCK